MRLSLLGFASAEDNASQNVRPLIFKSIFPDADVESSITSQNVGTLRLTIKWGGVTEEETQRDVTNVEDLEAGGALNERDIKANEHQVR